MAKYEGVVEGWDADYEYKDAHFGPPFFLPVIKKCEDFEFDENDILLAAYPKTGNTWLEEIVWLICNSADVEASSKTHIMERFPLMELKYGDNPAFVEILDNAPPPRFINTHLPFHLIRKNIEKAKPKVVVCMRNPKDQLVSFWHFHNSYPGRKVENFNDFFQMYKDENLAFGSYIKHCSGWWDERERENVFVITYEQVKEDHYGSVQRLAEFLEKDLSPEQLQTITDATSMSSMKARNVSKGATVDHGSEEKKAAAEAKGDTELKSDAFFRKGIIGDWKNVFSKEQNAFIEKQCKDILEPKGLKFKFE